MFEECVIDFFFFFRFFLYVFLVALAVLLLVGAQQMLGSFSVSTYSIEAYLSSQFYAQLHN